MLTQSWRESLELPPHRRQPKRASEEAGYPDRPQEESDRFTTAVFCHQRLELCFVLVALNGADEGWLIHCELLDGKPATSCLEGKRSSRRDPVRIRGTAGSLNQRRDVLDFPPNRIRLGIATTSPAPGGHSCRP